jgi:hypothetical protein
MIKQNMIKSRLKQFTAIEQYLKNNNLSSRPRQQQQGARQP